MTNTVNITDTSKAVFTMYYNDAGNWGGTPGVGLNVGGSKEERGNLTQLKQAGLIETYTDEGIVWVVFTDAGLSYAKELGLKEPNWI
jgi:hypothetical protein